MGVCMTDDVSMKQYLGTKIVKGERTASYLLYKKTNKALQSMDRFIEALDCLFFLNRITFDKRTEKIDVIRNQM